MLELMDNCFIKRPAWPYIQNKNMKSYHLPLLILILLSCGFNKPNTTQSTPPGHQLWTDLLQKHVRQDGMVDYRGFIKDSTKLNQYLSTLENHIPADNWSEKEKLAYWINAYNAYTIQLVIRHYPLESIKDISGFLSIPFVNSAWDIKFIELGGEKLDLNNIEHSILRKEFDEPRIHFAINCASISCPVLRNEAFTADKLEAQLEEQTKIFLNNPEKNRIGKNEIEISKIFSWFGGDFKKEGTIIDFINPYTATDISPGASVKYIDYNWQLNDSK